MGDDQKHPDWFLLLDDRTRLHVFWAQAYAQHYAHGAPGHLDLMTINTLAEMLGELQTTGALQNPQPKREYPLKSD